MIQLTYCFTCKLGQKQHKHALKLKVQVEQKKLQRFRFFEIMPLLSGFSDYNVRVSIEPTKIPKINGCSAASVSSKKNEMEDMKMKMMMMMIWLCWKVETLGSERKNWSTDRWVKGGQSPKGGVFNGFGGIELERERERNPSFLQG